MTPEKWEEAQIVTKETIEGYKRSWAKFGFPDVDLKSDRTVGCQFNEPTQQITPEQEMLMAMLREIALDIRKETQWWDKPCHDCHIDAGCKCIVETTRGEPRIALGGKGRWRQCPNYHTNRDCALKWVASDDCERVCNLVGISVSWFRKQLREDRNAATTVQDTVDVA